MKEDLPLRYSPGNGGLMVGSGITESWYRSQHPTTKWLYDPWTGIPRASREVHADPFGKMIERPVPAIAPNQRPESASVDADSSHVEWVDNDYDPALDPPPCPVDPHPRRVAAEILRAGIRHMEDRAVTYDNAEGENSMPATVRAFNAIVGTELTVEQGFLFLAVLKAARTQQGGYRADNYEDGAAYFGLMGEEAARSRGN